MNFGSSDNDPVMNKRLVEAKTGLRYSVSDQVDENGCYIIDYDGDSEEFFRKLGYIPAEEVEKNFMNIQNENVILS